MHTPDERIEELIAAAVAGDLSPSETEELRRLAAGDPEIEDEIARLRDVAARVKDADVTWVDTPVSAEVRHRVLGQTSPPPAVGTTRRRGWAAPLLAAACLVVGIALGAGIPALTSLPPTGPPGTLGAHEQITVAEETGIQIDASLVAHTWGTEAFLDVTGLTVGDTYRVVFVGADGTEFPAGEMLGSSVAIHCRLNAAVLREHTVRLEVRDRESTVIASADLPEV